MSEVAMANIHYRYQKVVGQLNTDFRQLNNSIEHVRYVGSYGRGTAIQVKAADVLIELSNAALARPAGDSPLWVLRTLCGYIAVMYPRAVVNSQAGAVALQFDDGIGFNLETSAGSPKSAQPLGAPSKKLNMTNSQLGCPSLLTFINYTNGLHGSFAPS